MLEWAGVDRSYGGDSRGLCRGGSVAAKPTAGNSWAGNSSDGLPQPVDRAEDRGDHHDHRAGDAHCQNVIEHRVSERAFTAVLPVELALERPRGAGLPERRPVDEFVSRAARQFSRART